MNELRQIQRCIDNARRRIRARREYLGLSCTLRAALVLDKIGARPLGAHLGRIDHAIGYHVDNVRWEPLSPHALTRRLGRYPTMARRGGWLVAPAETARSTAVALAYAGRTAERRAHVLARLHQWEAFHHSTLWYSVAFAVAVQEGGTAC